MSTKPVLDVARRRKEIADRPPRSGWKWAAVGRVRSVVPVACAIAALLGLWAIAASRTNQYVLPSPTSVAGELIDHSSLYFSQAGPTITEAALGFAFGTVLAIVMAVAFVFSRTLRQSVFPLAVGLNSVPLVAIAPLLIIALGSGLTTIVVITTLISYFPTLIAMTQGLVAVEPEAVEYFQTLRAGRIRTLFLLRWPASLPNLFIGLRISASSVVISAVIAEWVDADKGLGYLIIVSSRDFSILTMWAAVVSATILALAAFGAVLLAEKWTLRGRPRAAHP